MRIVCTFLIVMVGAALVAVLAYGLRASFLPWFASWLDVGEPPSRVDCAMVLPGNAETRPYVAAALVNVGLADRVLLTDTVLGPDAEDGIRPPSVELNRRVVIHRGVPENKIVRLIPWQGFLVFPRNRCPHSKRNLD
jgi:hypothetical protein